jgi:purine-binding chemotaxis protein CheW
MDNQVVVFELGAEQYGVNIDTVESIIKMQDITGMPHAPSFVQGVTNLRGKVLPVIDLRLRFGMSLKAADKSSRIIVIGVNDTEIGMIVDGVSAVLTISDQVIEPPPPITTTVDSNFITGIAKLDDRMVIMLDLDRILSLEEQADLSGVQLAMA